MKTWSHLFLALSSLLRARADAGSYGRKSALVLGLLAGIGGTLVFGLADSLRGLWLSMLPSALLSHQFLVLKALASDWAQAAGSSAAQRGAVMGQLGTAVKLGATSVAWRVFSCCVCAGTHPTPLPRAQRMRTRCAHVMLFFFFRFLVGTGRHRLHGGPRGGGLFGRRLSDLRVC